MKRGGIDQEKAWTRGPDTEKSRLRQFIRGSGYTPWGVVTAIVV